jgi:hypothetical protein
MPWDLTTFSVFKAPHKRLDSKDQIPKADHSLTNRLASKADSEGSGIPKSISVEKMLIRDLPRFTAGEGIWVLLSSYRGFQSLLAIYLR